MALDIIYSETLVLLLKTICTITRMVELLEKLQMYKETSLHSIENPGIESPRN